MKIEKRISLKASLNYGHDDELDASGHEPMWIQPL
jgi:hypothetical protein